jgi:hypothetical protein
VRRRRGDVDQSTNATLGEAQNVGAMRPVTQTSMRFAQDVPDG